MSDPNSTRIRIDLARGHWALGEREEAVECLERAAVDAPRLPELLKLVDEMLLDGPDPRLDALRHTEEPASEEPSPLATPTLAHLLAEQGHHDRAREVAEQSLRRNPDDSRARELHRQLAAPDERPARDDRKLQILQQLLARIQKRGSRVRHHDFS